MRAIHSFARPFVDAQSDALRSAKKRAQYRNFVQTQTMDWF
jgi:hypothetical protein